MKISVRLKGVAMALLVAGTGTAFGFAGAAGLAADAPTLVVLALVRWVIGAVFALVQLAFVVVIAVAVIWAIASARSNR